MKAKTNNDYYNIMLEGCKEAFENMELKEYLYTNEAINNFIEYSIPKESIEQIGIDTANDLTVNYRINDKMTRSFLTFLDRQQVIFEKKYLVSRNEFYQRCMNVINIKRIELFKENKYRILRGITNLGNQPDPFLFMECVKHHIENRSEPPKQAAPQKKEVVIPDMIKKELHNDIFKYNAFEVFELYKEKKQINLNSRTDLRVVFELLKGDSLLLETIELKHYIKWLNRVYYNGDITELKKQNLNSKPNILRTNDYIDYKKATLNQP